MSKYFIEFLRKKVKYIQFGKRSTLGKNCLLDAYSGCINNTKSKESIKIGNNCAIRGVLYAVKNGSLEIGNNTYIGSNTQIGAIEKVSIGSYVVISNYVRIIDNNNHPTDPLERLAMSKSGFYNENWEWSNSDHKPIIVEDNVWIGEFVRICKGVRIGKGSIVAASAIVTKDVPDYSIVAGNPARVVKKLKPINDRRNDF